MADRGNVLFVVEVGVGRELGFLADESTWRGLELLVRGLRVKVDVSDAFILRAVHEVQVSALFLPADEA